MGCNRGGYILRLRDARPGDGVPGLLRQLAHELALGAPIALAKGMDGVDLAEKLCRTLAESCRLQPSKEILRLQFGEGFGKCKRNVHGRSKRKAVHLCHTNLAKLSGPWKHILKEIPMDRAQVGKVK